MGTDKIARGRKNDAATFEIRSLTARDARFAGILHAEQLPHGLFGRLGAGFLEPYYRAFTASPHAVARIALLNGRPVGVLVGTLDDAEHYRWMLRHRGLGLGLWGLTALALRPRELVRFARTRSRRYARGVVKLLWPAPSRPTTGPTSPAPAVQPASQTAVLTHVCVAAWGQGMGVGGALVDDFLQQAHHRGASRARLMTLADERGAGAFYRQRGWQNGETVCNLDGDRFACYVRRLP